MPFSDEELKTLMLGLIEKVSQLNETVDLFVSQPETKYHPKIRTKIRVPKTKKKTRDERVYDLLEKLKKKKK